MGGSDMIDITLFINRFIELGIKRGEYKNVKYREGTLYYEDENTSGVGELLDIYDTLTGDILKEKRVDSIEKC